MSLLRYGEQYVDNLAGCQLLCMARAECAGFELRWAPRAHVSLGAGWYPQKGIRRKCSAKGTP